MNSQQDILIVEDESRLRDLLLSAIPDMGFSARGARSAEEALDMMATCPAGIMILDLNLPGMSGLELLGVLHERWPETRVIIVTGYGDLAGAQKAIRLGVVDFLTKPTSLGDLERALDRARRQMPLPAVQTEPARVATTPRVSASVAPPQGSTLEDVERNHILAALDRNHGNRAATAAELGISVRTLYYRLAEFQRQGLLP